MRYAIIILLGLSLLSLTSCGESDPLEDQLSAWRKAGLETSEFESSTPKKLKAVSCFTGTVSGIHVTLCDYPNDEETKQATDAGRESIGNTTGLVLAKGQVLLVAADRDGTDPTGRTINTISRTFWGK